MGGICKFGQPIKVNWAYVSGQREDTSGYSINCYLMEFQSNYGLHFTIVASTFF
ncbi:hypothetical protein HanRHA438_Chr02g0052711 [Helianthus annuus]|nr:hypothetical protein HanRHA438_Chr02g0052711 [Helianthus annuus]